LWRAVSLDEIASAQTRPQAEPGQGLKILAREAENMAARNVPISQADWLWDCTTPHTALAGSSVPAGAIVVFRANRTTRFSLDTKFHCATDRLPRRTFVFERHGQLSEVGH
jgi:hypothetical protein